MTAVPPIQDFDDASFDPFAADDEVRNDIGDVHAGVREVVARGGPVQEGSLRTLLGLVDQPMHDPSVRGFVVMDPEAVRTLLADPETFSNDAYNPGVLLTFGNAINQMNPPEHTRFRRVFQKAFLPHVVAAWSERFVQPVIEELIEAFRGSRTAELVGQFTHQYPFKIIFRQLDLPERDVHTFQKLAETLSQRPANMSLPAEASRKLGVYLDALIAERRRAPGDDMISILAQVEVDGERLPDDVIVSFFRQLLNAAGDTTYRATSNMLVGLLRERPDQYRMLVEDRALVPRAVEEAMRWDSPINVIHRAAVRDVELCGVHIPAGSFIEVATSVVGRDPHVHDRPDFYDVLRPNQAKHFGFGYGPHVCIGQHLARLEMTRALNAFADNFPDLHLDPDHPPPEILGSGLRRPPAIHVLLH